MPRLRKRGKVWHATYYDENGKRRERSTRCTDKRAADTVGARWERQAADPDHAAAHEATMNDALNLLLADRAEKARAGRGSAATVRFYEQKVGHLMRVFEHPFRLRRLDAGAVDDYISQRRSEGAHENTISKELVALRAALKLAKRRKLWRGDIAEVLPVGFAPSYKPRERYLLPDELDALLGELLPDYAARCAFIVATSASRGEADRARREDIDAELTRVYLRGTKTATRERTVPIVADWQRGLVKYALEHATGVDRMLGRWHNVDRDLKQACARVGIERLSQNDLRRTYSHWMRAAGMPIELIAPSMGHADTTMVQRVYGRLDANELASPAPPCQPSMGAARNVSGARVAAKPLSQLTLVAVERGRPPWQHRPSRR